ncbi:MAG: FapA family protein, partial [Planctomycetota bacterium]
MSEAHLSVRVTVSPDRLSAVVSAPAGIDATALAPDQLEMMVVGAGVELTQAVHDAVRKLAAQAHARIEAGHPPGGFRATVARARAPRHGVDGRVEWLAEPAGNDSEGCNPPEPENKESGESPGEYGGAVDFYAQSRYVTVEPGDVVGRVHPAEAGEDGRDVTGRTLAAKPPREATLSVDETLVVTASGDIVAQAEGVLVRGDLVARVSKEIEVGRYVDFSTGNITFSGDVRIRKGVRDRFKVEAEGDVEVDGLIEAAQIVAGGSLRAKGGFAGRERGRARVGADLHARYLDNVEAAVGAKLVVDREAVNCAITVDGEVASPTGALIGGRLESAGPVEIGTLGSAGNVTTELVIGSVPRLESVYRPIAELLAGLDGAHAALLAEQTQLAELTKNGRMTTVDRQRQTELMFELSENRRLADRARPVAMRLAEMIESQRTYRVE